VVRLKAATAAAGTDVKALALTMIIATRPTRRPWPVGALQSRRRSGRDRLALRQRRPNKFARPIPPPANPPARAFANNGSKLIGSYATVADCSDEHGEVDGSRESW